MKKTVSILLVIVFLVTNLGFTIDANYCLMKKSYTYSLGHSHGCCCSKSDKGNCCKSKVIVIKKIKDSYVSTAAQTTEAHFESVMVEYKPLFESSISTLQVNSKFRKDYSPPDCSVPLNILHHTFLI